MVLLEALANMYACKDWERYMVVSDILLIVSVSEQSKSQDVLYLLLQNNRIVYSVEWVTYRKDRMCVSVCMCEYMCQVQKRARDPLECCEVIENCLMLSAGNQT